MFEYKQEDRLNFVRYCRQHIENKGYSVIYDNSEECCDSKGVDLVALKGKELVFIKCKYKDETSSCDNNLISELYNASLNKFLKIHGGVFTPLDFYNQVNKGKVKMTIMWGWLKKKMVDKNKKVCYN